MVWTLGTMIVWLLISPGLLVLDSVVRGVRRLCVRCLVVLVSVLTVLRLRRVRCGCVRIVLRLS